MRRGETLDVAMESETRYMAYLQDFWVPPPKMFGPFQEDPNYGKKTFPTPKKKGKKR